MTQTSAEKNGSSPITGEVNGDGTTASSQQETPNNQVNGNDNG